MNWIRIGERVHAVARGHKRKTLCGLSIARATAIEAHGDFDCRCGNCDAQWRHIGRVTQKAARRANRIDPRVVYLPRLKFKDFESEAF